MLCKRGGRRVNTQETVLEPERYCIEYYQKGKFDLANLAKACTMAAKNAPSFYYYTAMIEYLSGSNNLELLLKYFKKARQALEAK